jgi:2-dehydro-3-deoxyphosphogluconate aldolase/(4S)-4-hydroxy-2-oxoglutarate aldolase
MSNKDAVLHTLQETGIVAVIRIAEPADLPGICRALGDGGVQLAEIAMTVPNALDLIERISSEAKAGFYVGAGTVLDPITARMAILAGASFIVGPTFDPEVIDLSHLYGRAVMSGCLTPTEVVRAWRAGADVVKIFPGRIGTPSYFEDLKGPLPQVRLMPTGNVDVRTTPQYIRAGAVAVGVGRALVDPEAVKTGRLSVISENARKFRSIIDQARDDRG